MTGDEEARRLAEEVRELCVRQRGAALVQAEDDLQEMVRDGSMSGLSKLCRALRGIRGSKKMTSAAHDFELPEELADRAVSLRKLCRDRWRMISVQRKINRIRRLEAKGRCEKMIRLCRRHARHTRELYRTGQKAAAELAERFERVCEHDVPFAWLKKRLVDWREKAGPLTCRRARRIYESLAERYPHGPMVHLARSWLWDVCE
jgi:hypothetical protein